MSDLMQKLAMSKAIMDRHNEIGRGGVQVENKINTYQSHNDGDDYDGDNYEVPQATYNIPQELIQESRPSSSNDSVPLTKDKILSSKLPDEIKRLMIENPITATNPLMGGGPVLSSELIEKATKLMGTAKKQEIKEQTISKGHSKGQNVLDNREMRQMMKEVVEEVLKENGLLVESTDKASETMVIKVGQHIFEGKISRIKKLKG